MITAEGGFVAYLGTNDAYEVEVKALEGDEKCKLMVDAFCYQVSLEISRLAATVKGKVDAILLTGGIAYNKDLMEKVKAVGKKQKECESKLNKIKELSSLFDDILLIFYKN